MDISYRKLVAVDSKPYRDIRLESLKVEPEQPIDDRFVIGALDQQDLMGICGFLPFDLENQQESKNTGTTIQVYVKRAYRSRKIGLGLMQALLSAAFQIPDVEQVVLGVYPGNTSVIRVYEQAGFPTDNRERRELADYKEHLQMSIHREDWNQNTMRVVTE